MNIPQNYILIIINKGYVICLSIRSSFAREQNCISALQDESNKKIFFSFQRNLRMKKMQMTNIPLEKGKINGKILFHAIEKEILLEIAIFPYL